MSTRLGKISLTLDPKSIEKAITEVKLFQKRLREAVKELTKWLTEQGQDVVQAQIIDMNAIDTTLLLNSVYTFFRGRTGHVQVTSPYAIYVEYGTGILGSGHPEGNGWRDPPPPSYKGKTYDRYDSQGHGESGWFYPYGEGQVRWTQGMVTRPFMYMSMLVLERMAEEYGVTIIARYMDG